MDETISTAKNQQERLCYKPWRHFADGCPWRQCVDGMLCCNGAIDDCGVSAPCTECRCALYHFCKKNITPTSCEITLRV